MLWPKKNSYKEFDNQKNSCSSKIPLPPHNFSNGPTLRPQLLTATVCSLIFSCDSLSYKWKVSNEAIGIVYNPALLFKE